MSSKLDDTHPGTRGRALLRKWLAIDPLKERAFARCEELSRRRCCKEDYDAALAVAEDLLCRQHDIERQIAALVLDVLGRTPPSFPEEWAIALCIDGFVFVLGQNARHEPDCTHVIRPQDVLNLH